MGTLNVNRQVSDAFYRYKMPRLLAKVEGKGNGIKTVIVNMVDVAKSLGRPATYPTKYFGCELGAQTLTDFKNDRFIVNGSHEASKLQDLLDGFIRKFVLCPECDNPETDLIVNSKKETISQGCKACGFHGLLQFNHKLNTYIIKNPPNLNPGTQGASLTEGKRSKRKGNKQNGDATNGDRSGSPKSEEEPEIIVALGKKSSKKDDDDDEVDWAVDTSEEAVRARLQDLTDGAKHLTLTDDLEKTEKERMDIFYGFVKHRKDTGDLSNIATAKEILSEAERLEIKSKAPLVLAELLFDDKIHVQTKRFRGLLLRFTHEDAKAQKALIGGVEQIIALHKASLLPKVPAIFKLLYDEDILDEGVLLEWGGKIEYDDRAKASPLKEHKPTNKPVAAAAVDDGEDDVDIDAI
uniref:Eukaryotic translation initiation factor 5 n=1 Tax=Lygus hesperus TaxID=30085 RepID=A0A0K8SM34_LYGHE